MKKLITLIFVANSFFAFAQNFETKYTKNYGGSGCGGETLNFNFSNDILTKTDNYYNSVDKIPSRRENTGFDDKGYFYELWTPTYYLERYGVNEYSRIKKFSYRILFDRKGGNLLYIFEADAKSGVNSGKFYFTELGHELYCK